MLYFLKNQGAEVLAWYQSQNAAYATHVLVPAKMRDMVRLRSPLRRRH